METRQMEPQRMATVAGGGDSYVLFELAGATYALRSDDVVQLEMVGAPPPTPVPNAPPYVDGVVSVRGQVIPAVSLRARFGFPRAEHDLRSRLVVVRSQGRTVGLIVDSAREFASIPPDAIRPLPEGVGGTTGRYLRGVAQRGDRLVLVVDVPELLALDAAATDSVRERAPLGAAPDVPPTQR
jgi:purine-binding chemotaxis protein CheW